MEKLKSIYASAYAATVSIIATVIFTLATEFSTPFKTWFASFTGHHWVSKSWASIIIFAIIFAIISFTHKSVDEAQTKRALVTVQVFAVLGFVFLLGFFLFEYFE